MGMLRVSRPGPHRPAPVRRAVLLLALLVLSTVITPPRADAAAPHAGQEQQFLQSINRARAQRGLHKLVASPGAAGVARRWSRTMASDGRLRHNPRVSDQLPLQWRRWGENVGWASNVADGRLSDVTRRLHRAFMDSRGHRANVLGRFNQVGIGVAVDGDGTMWATMVFVDGPLPRVRRTGLRDVAGSTHLTAIRKAHTQGLIEPCDDAGSKFCPGRAATRTTVATAVARMLDLPRGRTSHFDDVAAPSYPDKLAAKGIVAGCAPDRFCPKRAVQRAELASMLVRALPALEPVDGDRFADLASDGVHTGAVNGLASAGVVKGCGASAFCPTDKVTRAQLATFVVRAMELRSTAS